MRLCSLCLLLSCGCREEFYVLQIDIGLSCSCKLHKSNLLLLEKGEPSQKVVVPFNVYFKSICYYVIVKVRGKAEDFNVSPKLTFN